MARSMYQARQVQLVALIGHPSASRNADPDSILQYLNFVSLRTPDRKEQGTCLRISREAKSDGASVNLSSPSLLFTLATRRLTCVTTASVPFTQAAVNVVINT